MTKPSILLVDDDEAIQDAFGRLLQAAGYEFTLADNGEQAVERLAHSGADIVVADLCLSGLSGLDLLRYLRERDFDGEVILITGFASVDTAIQALREGACDYLTKPVHKETLLGSLARAEQKLIQARQRRGALAMMEAGLKQFLTKASSKAEGHAASPSVSKVAGRYRVGPVMLDVDRFLIEVDGRAIDATPSEFEILHYLCRHPDRVVSPEELVQSIRGYSIDSGEAREVIRPHVSNLRRKLLVASQRADVIVTIRSVGYMLKLPLGQGNQGGQVLQPSGAGSV